MKNTFTGAIKKLIPIPNPSPEDLQLIRQGLSILQPGELVALFTKKENGVTLLDQALRESPSLDLLNLLLDYGALPAQPNRIQFQTHKYCKALSIKDRTKLVIRLQDQVRLFTTLKQVFGYTTEETIKLKKFLLRDQCGDDCSRQYAAMKNDIMAYLRTLPGTRESHSFSVSDQGRMFLRQRHSSIAHTGDKLVLFGASILMCFLSDLRVLVPMSLILKCLKFRTDSRFSMGELAILYNVPAAMLTMAAVSQGTNSDEENFRYCSLALLSAVLTAQHGYTDRYPSVNTAPLQGFYLLRHRVFLEKDFTTSCKALSNAKQLLDVTLLRLLSHPDINAMSLPAPCVMLPHSISTITGWKHKPLYLPAKVYTEILNEMVSSLPKNPKMRTDFFLDLFSTYTSDDVDSSEANIVRDLIVKLHGQFEPQQRMVPLKKIMIRATTLMHTEGLCLALWLGSHPGEKSEEMPLKAKQTWGIIEKYGRGILSITNQDREKLIAMAFPTLKPPLLPLSEETMFTFVAPAFFIARAMADDDSCFPLPTFLVTLLYVLSYEIITPRCPSPGNLKLLEAALDKCIEATLPPPEDGASVSAGSNEDWTSIRPKPVRVVSRCSASPHVSRQVLYDADIAALLASLGGVNDQQKNKLKKDLGGRIKDSCQQSNIIGPSLNDLNLELLKHQDQPLETLITALNGAKDALRQDFTPDNLAKKKPDYLKAVLKTMLLDTIIRTLRSSSSETLRRDQTAGAASSASHSTLPSP